MDCGLPPPCLTRKNPGGIAAGASSDGTYAGEATSSTQRRVGRLGQESRRADDVGHAGAILAAQVLEWQPHRTSTHAEDVHRRLHARDAERAMDVLVERGEHL